MRIKKIMLSWPPVGSTNSNEIAPESEYKSSFSFLVSCISQSCSQWSSNVRTLKSNVKIADSAKRYMESSYNWSAGRICWCANTSDDNKTIWFKILKFFFQFVLGYFLLFVCAQFGWNRLWWVTVRAKTYTHHIAVDLWTTHQCAKIQ